MGDDEDEDGSGEIILPAYVNLIGIRWSDAELTLELGYKCHEGGVVLGKFAMTWALGHQMVEALCKAQADIRQIADGDDDRVVH